MACQTGYSSPGYFATAFRGKYGCPPSEWRERSKTPSAKPATRCYVSRKFTKRTKTWSSTSASTTCNTGKRLRRPPKTCS
ncbi:MAG: helix-turn-helix domain-containing protein [Saprospiraceae bacterium]